MKVAIIGAGISGVSCGALRDDGIDCHVYEQRSIIGGLVRCSIEKDDVLFHRVGGHVFNTKSSRVNEWFWAKFDKDNEFRKATRNAAVYLNEKFIQYPIENNIYNLDVEVWQSNCPGTSQCKLKVPSQHMTQ